MRCSEKVDRHNRVRRKEAIDFHINDATLTETNKPADFSFHGMVDLKPLGCENARATRLGEPPEKNSVSRKFLTKGLWLNNNKLTNLRGLDTFASNIIDKPELLTLIDFSFNRLTGIEDVVVSFKNLVVLYFHGNNISDPYELIKLHKLKKLRNVTFHGNPVSASPYYRKVVMLCMPTIVHLDHCPILKSERKQPLDPNALDLLKSYTGKRIMPGQKFKIEDIDLSSKPAPPKPKSEQDRPKHDRPVLTKKDSLEIAKARAAKHKPVETKELPCMTAKIKMVPGITSEFIKKRDGACRCCKNCMYHN